MFHFCRLISRPRFAASLLLAFCLSTALAVPAAHADAINLVSNPNFAGGTPENYPGYGPISGWTFQDPNAGSNSVYANYGGPFAQNTYYPDGITTTGFLQAGGFTGQNSTSNINTASTVLLEELTAGSTYAYSFFYDVRQAPYDDVNSFTFSIGDQVLYSVLTPRYTDHFTLVTGSFVANGSGNVLKFTNDSATDGTVNITGVTVAATPEPSSLALLGTGLLGMAGAVRRRLARN